MRMENGCWRWTVEDDPNRDDDDDNNKQTQIVEQHIYDIQMNSKTTYERDSAECRRNDGNNRAKGAIPLFFPSENEN